MTAFVMLSVLLFLAALLFVAGPLIRRRGGTVDQSRVDAVALTRERQLEELEQDLEDGVIDDRTYELSRRDIESEASRSQAHVESGQASGTGAPVSAIVFAVLLVVLTLGLYSQVGDWEAIDRDAGGMDEMSMDEAVHRLEQRLESHPDDLEGWMLLGRTRLALGEYDKAVAAYRKAVDLAGEDNVRVLAKYAEAVSLQDPARMPTEAAPMFRRVLELQPDHPKGLWYSGLIAFDEEHFEEAKAHWQRLLDQDPPQGFREVLEERLAAARAALGEEPESSPAEADEGRFVMVEVSVDESLAETLTPDDVVFLVARSTDGGPPLAGIRLPVSSLPGAFRLGDENAMLDGHQISGHDRVEIIARVSRSGQATPQSGDLVGRRVINVDDHGETPATLVIDETF